MKSLRTSKTYTHVIHCLTAVFLIAYSLAGFSHQTVENRKTTNQPESDPRNLQTLEWNNEHASRVVTAGYPDSLGLFAFNGRRPPQIKHIAGRQCMQANLLSIDIDDEQFHDVDQTLTLRLLLATQASTILLLGYDKNAEADAVLTLDGPSVSKGISRRAITSEQDGTTKQQVQWIEYSITLERARLANRGMGKTDISLATLATMLPTDEYQGEEAQLTLCDLSIAALEDEQLPAPSVSQKKLKVNLKILDENNTITPARVGLYDDTGRLIYSNSEAIELPYYKNRRAIFSLRTLSGQQQSWPHRNRYYFYSDGDWSATVEPGRYTLVATKGPEYRAIVKTFEVEKGTRQYSFAMKRWVNMPAQGWHSGDVHIHASRESALADKDLFTAFAAEDLHMANLLEMSNLGRAHYIQFDMGKPAQQQDQHIIPGVEAPRTALRGHAMALNTQEHYFASEQYYLYHEHLKTYQQQGAVTGYAHVGSEEFLASLGLALDVPWGLVDFVENLQNSKLRTELWYDFLNLGYQLSPAAGSDFPYFDQPGSVRNYVKSSPDPRSQLESQPPTFAQSHSEGAFSSQDWFEQLRAGRTFITNGPLLAFTVNGRDMGSTLPLGRTSTTQQNTQKPLLVNAQVKLSPDLDELYSIELIHCGKTIHKETAKAGQTHLILDESLDNIQHGWLAIKALGHRSALAHSAPIYLNSPGQPSWCPENFVETLTKVDKRLTKLQQLKPTAQHELEYWESSDMGTLYNQQKGELSRRITQTKARYHERLKRFFQHYPELRINPAE